ncbi:MAG: GTPase HflX [Bdellovibrionales bacterium]|nr:GTPase HflX [Bdellovibrionales bacterium]
MARQKDLDKKKSDRQAIERSKEGTERVVLVGVGLQSDVKNEYKESLLELMELTETAGAEVVGSLSQVMDKFNPATLIGKGKILEIKQIVEETKANLVIIDHQLTGAQAVNLEQELRVSVLDRTQLILDIFAQRAQTHEGKLQVELAQMLDQLPRMIGAWMGSHSRQGAGIGTRGPGETALEMDRRRVRERIDFVRKQLKEVQKRRSQHRNTRRRNKIPTFALIGYTNAGKSALMNQLTKSEIYSEDKLFATLDPTTRKVYLPGGPPAVLTDTVGFIRRLPTKLIEAFKATLEESAEADILLHVIDISNPQINRHVEVVNELITEFEWQNKPILHVYNKVDLATNEDKFKASLYPRIFVSALKGIGLDDLKNMMLDKILSLQKKVELFFQIEEKHKIYELDRETNILKQEHGSTGTMCEVLMTEAQIQKWGAYIIQKSQI